MNYCPIVLETEESGAISAFVPGLPVYAAADTRAKAEAAVRDVLSAYLQAHPSATSTAHVRVAQVTASAQGKARPEVRIRSVGTLLGAVRSRAKARASRSNGRLGGRPRLATKGTK
ncbi:MAG: hypothetical protein ABI634_10720 [Acidobacteriota bacterium]